jgi:hypothetical protein
MKTFRTDVSLARSSRPVGLKNPILTVGSCFADAMGARFDRYKFPVKVNPFGVAYNPVSIHKALLYATLNEPVPDHTFVENSGIHLNYDFHSNLSALRKDELNSRLLNTIGSVHYFLKHTSVVMITYGTSWVYERADTGEIVSNCHKIAAKQFNKRLLSENEIALSFQTLYASLKKFNPELRFIVTVSPVRHTKETLELNSLSKAILRSACHSISSTHPDVDYFPAFEIMTDDLRDYRFYKQDMIHPTQEAEDYIWGKFSDRYFDEETNKFLAKWDGILDALNHRPFHVSSPAHQAFLKDTLRKLEEMKVQLDVDEEIAQLKQQLNL